LNTGRYVLSSALLRLRYEANNELTGVINPLFSGSSSRSQACSALPKWHSLGLGIVIHLEAVAALLVLLPIPILQHSTRTILLERLHTVRSMVHDIISLIREERILHRLRIDKQVHGRIVNVKMLELDHVVNVLALGAAEDDADVLPLGEGVEHGNLRQLEVGLPGELDGEVATAVVLGVAVRLLDALEAPFVGAALDGGGEGGGVHFFAGP
jgi:hypothetical protein